MTVFCILYTILAMREGIRPEPLRQIIYKDLLNRIVTGTLEPGVPVRDTEISEEMGVSRTPVREALLRLARQGLLVNLHHRGFVVSEMTADVVKETYPMVRALECLALQESPPLPETLLAKLRRLNQSLENSADKVEKRISLDEQWHEVLLSGYENQRLKNAIAELKAVVRRYEFGYMRDVELVSHSVNDHARLLTVIENDGKDAALPLLEAHWRYSMENLLKRIK
ncbi:MAG: GntR family transcriptional regulator [Acidobacteria bacterium]|nr:GntR family transcriptional regulator [Acidobacteriota bacterium]